MRETIDVLVVGAGPTGLMMAGWLARLGVKARVVDPKPGPTRETRALAVQARTLETYDMLGLGERALREGLPAVGATWWVHGRQVGRLSFADLGATVTPHPYVLIMGQDRTERMLLEDLEARGGAVEWGTGFVSLAQDPDGCDVGLRRPDGTEETVRAAWVVGCDGARSPVRHALGVPFSGGTYDQRFFVADVRAEGPLPDGELSIIIDESRFLLFFPMQGPRHFRIVGLVPAALVAKPDLAMGDLVGEVKAHTGMDVAETNWFSTYNVHHRVADHFRVGRAFLAGDAAHVHSPVGGQGMNTGLMDASNLAWKLAAVVRGEADARLLDSYEAERVPFARLLVETTDRVFSIASSTQPVVGWLRALVAPVLLNVASSMALTRREGFGLVSQTRIRYDGPLSRGRAGGVRGGDRLPWTGTNYAGLAALRPQLHVYGAVPAGLEAFAAGHDLPLACFPADAGAREAGLAAGAVYLVRPDGYVAYASPRFDPDDLAAYLRERWGRTR